MLLGPLALLLVWLALTGTRLVSPLFLPTPISVAKSLVAAFGTASFWLDMLSTVYRVLAGFALGAVIGIPVGIGMGYSRKTYASLELVMDFFRSLPAMALFPLFLLAFGLGDKAKIAVSAWASFLFVAINTIYGVRSCSSTKVMVLRTMKATDLQLFQKVVLPSALPGIFAGFRVSISMCLVVIVITEMFMGTKNGLGKRIYDSSMMYRVPEMFAAILITGVLGYLLNKLSAFAEERIIHWHGR